MLTHNNQYKLWEYLKKGLIVVLEQHSEEVWVKEKILVLYNRDKAEKQSYKMEVVIVKV
jgi:hypothetical protein